MKKMMILIIIALLPITLGNGQIPFVLTTIQNGDYIIYEDMSNNNFIRFNVSEQSIYRSGNITIFVNTLNSNSSEPLETIKENSTLSNGNYTLTFLDVLNSSYIYSSKGIFLINGYEWRNIRLENTTDTLLEMPAKIDVKFDNGDRAITILTENPIIDNVRVTIDSNYTELEPTFYSHINYEVSYLPSNTFNLTYKTQNVTAKNITEKFSYQSSSFIYYSSLGNFTFLQFSLDNFTNDYVCAIGFGLPVLLIKKTFFNSTINGYLLYKYSGETEFPVNDSFNLLFVLIVFSVIIFRRKRSDN